LEASSSSTGDMVRRAPAHLAGRRGSLHPIHHQRTGSESRSPVRIDRLSGQGWRCSDFPLADSLTACAAPSPATTLPIILLPGTALVPLWTPPPTSSEQVQSPAVGGWAVGNQQKNDSSDGIPTGRLQFALEQEARWTRSSLFPGTGSFRQAQNWRHFRQIATRGLNVSPGCHRAQEQSRGDAFQANERMRSVADWRSAGCDTATSIVSVWRPTGVVRKARFDDSWQVTWSRETSPPRSGFLAERSLCVGLGGRRTMV
jgi:hypothetical protein